MHCSREIRLLTHSGLLLCALVLGTAACSAKKSTSASQPRVHLRGIGPRLISNQTSQPLAIYGDGFQSGMRLHLGAPFERDVAVTVIDKQHAYLRLGGLEMPSSTAEATVPVTTSRLEGAEVTGEAKLTVVNDNQFPDLVALVVSRDGKFAFAASITTDRLFAVELSSRKVSEISVGDGPSALSTWVDAEGREWIAVVHSFAPELHLVSADGPAREHRILPSPSYATSLTIDPNLGIAYVAEHARNTITALKLAEGGRVVWRAPVSPNPRALAIVGDSLAVGSLQTGEVELLDRSTGKSLAAVAPRPGTPIIGGRTERYSKYIMGGKAPRHLVWSARLRRLFVSSIGPNIGPNPDRWEISGNGGVGVIDPKNSTFVRHLGFDAGVTEGMTLDEKANLLYVADIALGLIRVIDAKKLADKDQTSRSALIQEIPISPPPEFPLARPRADYGVRGRAGPEMHSGPKALALSADRSTLFVLNRFTGTLAMIDVRQAARGRAAMTSQIVLTDVLAQGIRRTGQILYFADFGRSGMSCDSCHLEGHTEGIFFEKTHPLRIYRATTVRGSRETPPYFTPASTFSLAQTASFVGSRNRLHNPNLTQDEVNALTLYSETLATLPNPFVGTDGAPSKTLELPDGAIGRTENGMRLFEGKALCSQCHPAPLFTTDQDPATRGRYASVGTPPALPLRVEMQNLFNQGFAPPSLLGAWDIFPMLSSGAAGFDVRPDGSVGVATRFPLRAVVELYGKPPHGNASALTADERNDLLAYLLTL
jgi:sugar lactone lactonase YvrE